MQKYHNKKDILNYAFTNKNEAAMWSDIDTARYLVKVTPNYVEHIKVSIKTTH